MPDMRVVVAGAAGRMGQMLVKAVLAASGCRLVGALERPGSPALGQDAGLLAGAGATGVMVSDDMLAALVNSDALLDFTTPASTVALAALAAQARLVHVIGTTGLAEADYQKLEAAARHAVIVQSGNMSLGVNLLAELVRRAAASLDADYDIEIVEMHHRHKVDAPSGTALLLGEAAASGRGVPLNEHSDRGRDGHTGARKRGDIGFASLRGGSVIGDHSVVLAGQGERIELRHVAEDRGVFAEGALKAAFWGRGRKPGFYAMTDVLGLAKAPSP
ncbi:MAG: 4-hydroxy-tetrahydrodipicolinate reductase [Beijerinckiaceae bacterium]|nr:4-hydroxy-tetrahydrodipicolinate reductase [Beijerinckiaceae bacterium]